jgi:predicted nucleotidyltransferase
MIGCYRNVARKGQQIEVSGMLERVENTKTGKVTYQVVVGTLRKARKNTFGQFKA